LSLASRFKYQYSSKRTKTRQHSLVSVFRPKTSRARVHDARTTDYHPQSKRLKSSRRRLSWYQKVYQVRREMRVFPDSCWCQYIMPIAQMRWPNHSNRMLYEEDVDIFLDHELSIRNDLGCDWQLITPMNMYINIDVAKTSQKMIWDC